MNKITLILISTALIAAGCNNTKPEQSVIDEAIVQFNALSYNARMLEEPENTKLLIKAITGEDGWEISSEDINFEKTKHFEFPLIANSMLLLNNQSKPGQLIGQEQLFMYGFERDEWFPISVKTYTYKDKEIVGEKTENLWSKGNDWHEIFKEEDLNSTSPTLEELAD